MSWIENARSHPLNKRAAAGDGRPPESVCLEGERPREPRTEGCLQRNPPTI